MTTTPRSAAALRRRVSEKLALSPTASNAQIFAALDARTPRRAQPNPIAGLLAKAGWIAPTASTRTPAPLADLTAKAGWGRGA